MNIARRALVATASVGGVGLIALSALAPTASATSYPVRTATSYGHRTTPVWYHDSVATRVGAGAAVAWTSNAGSVLARPLDLATGAWSGPPVKVSTTTLNCRCVDSTGTNPSRHDVPTLLTDRTGRIYALYGGGTAAQTGDRSGPFLRIGADPATIATWYPEQRMTVPGAVYDMQAAATHAGIVDVIGQQGHNAKGAGSLLLLQLHPGTRATPGHFVTLGAPYRTLIAGGAQSTACGWRFTPGCDIFVEANLTVGPTSSTGQQRLFLVWNWAEANLSNSCGDPAGFCNHGLYAAYSDDQGRTWHNRRGTASIDITSEPLSYDDPAFALLPATTNVGLFKAVAVSGSYPGTPWIAYQPGANINAGTIRVGRWSATRWTSTLLDRSRSWNNHLVMDAADTGLLLWSDIAQSGTHASEIARWQRSPATGTWRKTVLPVGQNWYLTGTTVGGRELLVWRAPAATKRTRVDVMIATTH